MELLEHEIFPLKILFYININIKVEPAPNPPETVNCRQWAKYLRSRFYTITWRHTRGGRVVRYRHVCLELPSGVGTPWPYFVQLP